MDYEKCRTMFIASLMSGEGGAKAGGIPDSTTNVARFGAPLLRPSGHLKTIETSARKLPHTQVCGRSSYQHQKA